MAVVFNDYLYTFTLVSDPSDGGRRQQPRRHHHPGPTFAEIMLGVAPVAILCAFFADTYGKGFEAGVVTP